MHEKNRGRNFKDQWRAINNVKYTAERINAN